MSEDGPASEELPPVRGSPRTRRSLRGIALYYGLILGAAALILWRSSDVRRLFEGGRMQEISGQEQGFLEGLGQMAGGAPGAQPWGFEGMLAVTVSMLAALVLMVPVAWTYIVIKRRQGYEQSIVHTLIILPLAVTGIVIVVKNSLALAFSLAGIVAAVRFRTTLKDNKDAVYVFLAIGVGLATGVQALGVAIAISVVFNVVNLALWFFNFGNIYADQFGRNDPLGLGDVLAGPESGQHAFSIGDRELLTALSPQELREAVGRVARMERHLEAEEEDPKERKSYGVLLVYCRETATAQRVVEPEMEERSVRWRLAEILPHEGDVQILEYLVRLKEGISAGALLDAVRRAGGETVKAAEFRSLEGLKKKK